MKRDINLFRTILLQCEEFPHGSAPAKFEIDGFNEEQIGFHIYLLGEAGLLRTSDVSGFGDKSPQAIAHSITNDGYDLLERTRDPETWQKVQGIVAKVGGWTVRTITLIAVEVFSQKVAAEIKGML